jgi:hypothetical protein
MVNLRMQFKMGRTEGIFGSKILAFLLLVAAVPFSTQAQHERLNSGVGNVGATANYRFAESNEFPITVTLLGAVARPGRYEISRKINLVNALALAGGWREDADMSDVRISRDKGPEDPGQRTEIRLNLENLAEALPQFLQLQDGDCVYVGTATRVTLPVFLSIVSSAATVAIAVAYFTNR